LGIYWPDRASFGGGGFMSGLVGQEGDTSGWIQGVILIVYCFLWFSFADACKWILLSWWDGKETGTWGLTEEQMKAKNMLSEMQKKKLRDLVEDTGTTQYVKNQNEYIKSELRKQNSMTSISGVMVPTIGIGKQMSSDIAKQLSANGLIPIQQMSSMTHRQRQESMQQQLRVPLQNSSSALTAQSEKRLAYLEKTLADQTKIIQTQGDTIRKMEDILQKILQKLTIDNAAADLADEF